MPTAVVRVALALEILLICIEGVLPANHGSLPLGNSHLAQLGLVLGLAVVIAEIREARKPGKFS
jgi:hypothetical protein